MKRNTLLKKFTLILSIALVIVLIWIVFFHSNKRDSYYQTDIFSKTTCSFIDNVGFKISPFSTRNINFRKKYMFKILPRDEVDYHMKKFKNYNSKEWESTLLKLASSNLMINKYLITVVANYGHLEFVLNLIANLNDFGYTKFLIICLDLLLYENLVKYNFAEHAVLVPSTWLPFANISTHEAAWETKDYYPITRSKVFVANKLVQHGFTILFTDVDVIWLSPNILNYIDFVAPDKDFVYSIDNAWDVNTGFYMVRSNEGGKKIFKAIDERLKDDLDHDQYVVNRVFSANPEFLNKHGYGLDKLLFANGHTYFHEQMNKKLDIQPLTFHANYLIGFDKKKCILIQANMWYI